MERNGKNPLIHEEVELSLGLSTNGRFGVDPTRVQKLDRSSFVANSVFAIVRGGGSAAEFEAHAPPPGRTQSLPTETKEEALRRRKKLDPIEARRKRMGKIKALREKRNGASGVGDVSILRRFENKDVMVLSGPHRAGSSGSSNPTEGSHEPSADDAQIATPKLPKNPMLDMPLVTTKDIGPNSRRVQGILYRYKKGEEVNILCVCHGVFLTAKEFVAHGGGGDVERPLKHIVVSPFPLK